MKKIFITLGITLMLGLVAAGGFWGGMQYQTQRSEQIRADFFSNRPQGPAGQAPDQGFNFQPGDQPGGAFPGVLRGGTTGTIKSIDGNVITLSTAQDVTTVHLTDSSQINQVASVPASALQPGMSISVAGERDSDGILEAGTITILKSNPNLNP